MFLLLYMPSVRNARRLSLHEPCETNVSSVCLGDQSALNCVFKSQATFSVGFGGVSPSFKFGLKLSRVFTFKKAQKVLESKKRENKGSWDLCSHYLYSLFGQQDKASQG